VRERTGVKEEEAIGGDIVVGRNTWKEYVRGLHEGWLGPLQEPKKISEDPPDKKLMETEPQDRGSEAASNSSNNPFEGVQSDDKPRKVDDITDILAQTEDDTMKSSQSSTSEEPKNEENKPENEEKKETEKKKRPQPPPFIDTNSYSSALLPPSISNRLDPSIAVPLPVIFGFLNTPIRIYRFLHQRHLADEVGRRVAAAAFAAHGDYQQVERPVDDQQWSPPDTKSTPGLCWEQELLLAEEEPGWHKSYRKKDPADERERVWLDPVVVDQRIGSRMAKFVLPPSDNWDDTDTTDTR